MTAPTEKDAMALATLAACEAYIDTTDSFHDRPGEGSPVAEHRKARAHLASRIAELEAERDEANERAARTAAQYQHEFEAHGQTIERAERAEAELAAVRSLLIEIRGDCEVAYGVSEQSYRQFCGSGAMGRMPSDTWARHCQRRIEQIDAARGGE